ncbi:conserved hypothetical protein [Gloeothece citriformis PCC 7424]|uniref:Uncharacterized protein n=2 Tax=Gloeothece TaxID=28070 RepID=B7KFW1_GLOC7|nr:conserved hypothetical protein [Gloeothece citriformis PCC 7424]
MAIKGGKMPEEAKQPKINENELSQEEMIQLLQKTIGQLEGLVNKLNTESIENLPPRTVVETLTTNTDVLTELLGERKVSTSSEPLSTETVTPPETTDTDDIFPDNLFDEENIIDLEEPTEPVEVDPATLKSIESETWWRGLLDKIRSNWAIIGLVSTVLVAVVVGSLVFVSRPSPEIAQTPPTTEILPPPQTPVIVPSPSPQTPEAIETPETPEAIETPLEIEAPGNPEPVEFAPPPQPELTPEQSLIASIQEEVSELTRQYPEGLIATIEANFLGSRLIVTMGNQWYSLDTSAQNQVANGIFERSRRLDFRKLELIDQQGNQLARSPVVGQDMIIFEGEKPLNSTP